MKGAWNDKWRLDPSLFTNRAGPGCLGQEPRPRWDPVLSGRSGACPAMGCCHPHPDQGGCGRYVWGNSRAKKPAKPLKGFPGGPSLPLHLSAPLWTPLTCLFTAAPAGQLCGQLPGGPPASLRRESLAGRGNTMFEMSWGAGLRNWVSPLQACGHLSGEDGALVKPWAEGERNM